MFKDGLSLVYFTADTFKAKRMVNAGVDAIFIDCETAGKIQRQDGYDTEINYNQPEVVSKIHTTIPSTYIMCRVNNADYHNTAEQIRIALEGGASAIVVPMIESAEQVRKIHKTISKRADLIIMIETQKGVDNFESISKEEFDGVYVGLNDLSISRGGAPLFDPLSDGTIEYIISATVAPVGVGGVTDPSHGYPIKSAYVISEYARLGVAFTILRRSFDESVTKIPARKIIKNIKLLYELSPGLQYIREQVL